MAWVGKEAGRDSRSRPASPAQPVPRAPCHAASASPPPLLPWEAFYPNLLLGCFLFPFFSSPQTCSCSSRSHGSGEPVTSFPSGAFLRWPCLSPSPTWGIPHLPHSPSPWLLSPLRIVPEGLGVPAPIVGSCPAPLSPHLSPALSPGHLGVVGGLWLSPSLHLAVE